MPLPPGVLPPPVKVALLSDEGICHLLWVSASMTAMARHLSAVPVSPGALVRIVEGASAFMSLAIPVGAYRLATRGTLRIKPVELLDATWDPNAFMATRRQLYTDMVRNLFTVYIPRGPAALKQYIEHVVMVGNGAQRSIQQFFDELRAVNQAGTDEIDRLRRQVYAVKITAELSMVLLGAGPVPLLWQLGVGVGYTIVTNVITEFSGMQHCDMIAMPWQFTKANASSIGANLAQEGVDKASEEWIILEGFRQRALALRKAVIETKIAELLEKGRLRGADKNLMRALRQELQDVSYKMVHSAGATSAATSTAGMGVRGVGIGVGIYFLREDLQQVLAFIRDGDL